MTITGNYSSEARLFLHQLDFYTCCCTDLKGIQIEWYLQDSHALHYILNHNPVSNIPIKFLKCKKKIKPFISIGHPMLSHKMYSILTE